MFVRTVLGDIDPGRLGVTFAHEHLVIDGGRPVELNPDFLLADVDLMASEVKNAQVAGLQSVVDAMPAGAGRNVEKLAEISTRTGLNIVAPTGLHHERFYPAEHWSERKSVEELADLFIADIAEGIDANDYAGAVVRRTGHRAGVIKVAGSEGGPSERDRRIFLAAAHAHRATGAPILTHCERGTGGLEQMELLTDAGVHPQHVILSHADKVTDPAYHHELADTGGILEYDQAFRWSGPDNPTLELLSTMVEADYGDRIVLGMDAARQGYYRVYGGRPGLAYLLTEFTSMMTRRGLGEDVQRRLFVHNPARAFAFAEGERR